MAASRKYLPILCLSVHLFPSASGRIVALTAYRTGWDLQSWTPRFPKTCCSLNAGKLPWLAGLSAFGARVSGVWALLASGLVVWFLWRVLLSVPVVRPWPGSGSLAVYGCVCLFLWPLVFLGRQPENWPFSVYTRSDPGLPLQVPLMTAVDRYALSRFPSSDGSCVSPHKSALATDFSRRRMCESGFRLFRVHVYASNRCTARHGVGRMVSLRAGG